jgi:hypothetical protein
MFMGKNKTQSITIANQNDPPSQNRILTKDFNPIFACFKGVRGKQKGG